MTEGALAVHLGTMYGERTGRYHLMCKHLEDARVAHGIGFYDVCAHPATAERWGKLMEAEGERNQTKKIAISLGLLDNPTLTKAFFDAADKAEWDFAVKHTTVEKE